MAFSMNGGDSGGRRRFRGMSTLSEINIVPLVDVVLVLLIIFMLTAHVMEFGLEVEVPKVKQTRDSAQELPVVTITRDGRLYLNEQAVNINDLGAAVEAEVRQRPGGLRARRQGDHLGNRRAGDQRAGRRQDQGERRDATGGRGGQTRRSEALEYKMKVH